MNLEQELTTSIAAVHEASILCQHVQAQLENATLKKADRSPVTVADFGSQSIICSSLREAFPHDSIIAEENADVLRTDDNHSLADRVVTEVQALRPNVTADEVIEWIDYGGDKDYTDRFWTLDPIDGTKGFLRGDQYAIALGLIQNGTVVLAVVGCPNLILSEVGPEPGVLLSATRGNGVQIHRLSDMSGVGKASVSSFSDPANVRLCESVEAMHTSHSGAGKIASILGITAAPVRLDSQAKYAVVACGDAEMYLRLPSDSRYVENIWDHAGGSLLVEEAGGMVTDIYGRNLDFSKGHQLKDNRGVIVSNGLLHDRLIDAIREAGIE
ncbi:MAG: 3'(2'),5'-bisphosphate nucleotidase [Rhodothermia bacterium]|nr:MAG: 3'(2'),5'-bisphosphate nucleotidase [Rhodothermia bacterium]